jgi:transposase
MYGDSMRYGRAIKESVLKRVLPPNAESIRSVSVDVRIAEQTIRNWIAKVDQGILGDDVQLGPRQLGAPEKFALLLEAAGLKEDERGPWIREKGLHTEHLQLWQQELRDTVAEKSNKDKQDLKDAKKRITWKWQAEFPHSWQSKGTHPEKKTISPSSLKFCMIHRPGKRHVHDAGVCPAVPLS